ncbi:MAG: secretin N-terminal domain-containing protein [Pirellulales bacterium]
MIRTAGAALLLSSLTGICFGQLATAKTRVYSLTGGDGGATAARLIDFFGALPEHPVVSVDPDGRQLRIRGSAKVHALTEQFLELADHAAPADVEPFLRIYRPRGNLDEAVAKLQGQLADRPDVRLVSDRRTGQILVLAPPAVHATLAIDTALRPGGPLPGGAPAAGLGESDAATRPRSQTAVDRPPSRATQNAPMTPSGTTPPRGPSDHLPLELRHIDLPTLHTRLQGLLERPLPETIDRSVTPPRHHFSLDGPSSGLVHVEAIEGTRHIVLSGPAPLVRSWGQVIRAIDAPTAVPARATQLVAVRTARPGSVQQVIAALRRSAHGRASSAVGTPATASRSDGNATASAGRMVAMLFQQGQGTADNGSDEKPDGIRSADTDRPEGSGADPINGGAIGPVDIQFLEGSDVIVIRGHQRDVARVRELIRQIEQLSVETEPRIVVRPLNHVNSQALAALLDQVYEQIYLARQGSISITSLVDPNALLLIGRAENVATVEALIERLDQPMDPATQFRVFRLRHASALEAKGTIDAFLEQQTTEDAAGLATTARVTADYRSNALIVRAAARDMAAVAKLIERLDTSTSEAVNELRIFQLYHSQAEVLAEILRRAIYVQQGQGAATAPATLPGRSGAAQAPAAPSTSSSPESGQVPRSAGLKFVTIDRTGKKRLRTGILTDVRITADPRANAVVVAAPADSMELIGALIQTLDRAPAIETQVKVFSIVNGDAVTLTELLEKLFGSTTGGDGIGPVDGERGLSPLRFSVDERTNTVVATGSSDDLEVVEAILLRLDETDASKRQTKVYRLKNSPAEAVANAVNEFLRTERQVQEESPGVVSPFEQIEREVVVVPEVISNSLIVSATPRYYEEILAIVEQLDERPPMVMIQVLIAEITLRDTDEFGVELGLQDSLLFDRSIVQDLLTTDTVVTTQNVGGTNTVQQQTIQSAPLAPGFNFNNGSPLGNNGGDRALGRAANVAGQALSSFAVGRANSELGFGGLVLSASSNAVSVLIRALQESRRLEILSRPQIMTLDTKPAYIQVGQRVPRIYGTAVDLGVQQNQIRDEDVGIILGVRPLISPDGLVVMEVDAIKSDVGPEAEGIPVSIAASGDVIRSPRINRTFAQTTVAAYSGQTVVIGGLITKNSTDVHRRVPFLASIPLLGNLFRYDLTTQRRTELLIILTPQVVRTQADAEHIKQVESERMNWCMADVVEIYGEAGLRGRCDTWGDDETATIYPELKPFDMETVPVPADRAPGYEGAGDLPVPEARPDDRWESTPPGILPMEATPGGAYRQGPTGNPRSSRRLTAERRVRKTTFETPDTGERRAPPGASRITPLPSID